MVTDEVDEIAEKALVKLSALAKFCKENDLKLS